MRIQFAGLVAIHLTRRVQVCMCKRLKTEGHSRSKSKSAGSVCESETTEGETRIWLLGDVEFSVVEAPGARNSTTLPLIWGFEHGWRE